MANRLIFYNSGNAGSNIFAANILRQKYPDATLKDVSGVTTGNITSYIAGLTANYYTDIFITCVSQLTPATGVLSFDQIASLDGKMISASKGSIHNVIRANTAQSNSTVTDIILDSGASASDDFYNGYNIVTAGTTAVSRYIKDYTGSSKTCVVNTTTTAITTTETFIVYGDTHIYQLGNTNATTGKTAVYQVWDLLYPDSIAPQPVTVLGGYLNVLCSGTAASIAAGTITLAPTASAGDRNSTATHTTDGAYDGTFVYIYSATAGACQVAEIASYVGSTQVATLTANWGITPTGTVVYRVVSFNDFRVYADRAMDIYCQTYMRDPSTTRAIKDTERLTDDVLSLNTAAATADVDLTYFYQCLDLGKSTFLSDALGVV